MNLLICITSINKYTALFVESLLFHTTTLGMANVNSSIEEAGWSKIDHLIYNDILNK